MLYKYRVEYHDLEEDEYGACYFVNANVDEVVEYFRHYFSKERYKIIEISRVIQKDWSKK